MNLNCYQYVISIAENASISKAAKELFITQPALTKYLNKLEADLGVRLFDRSISPLQITYAGELYVQEGRKIIEMHKRLNQQISEMSNMQRGRLTIGINSERGSWCRPVLVPEFRRLYPGIELKICEGHSRYLEEEILKNHIDLAIGTLPILAPDLDYIFLSDEPVILAVPTCHPIAQIYDLSLNSPYSPYFLEPESLNGHDMIILAQEQGMGRIAYQFFERYGISPHIVMTFKNNATALRMASAGEGITFALADTVSRVPLVQPMAWFSIENPVFCRKSVAYYRKSVGVSPIAEKFINLWKAMIQTNPFLKNKICTVVTHPPLQKI